jgi:phosphoserine phosphatase RsbU/P
MRIPPEFDGGFDGVDRRAGSEYGGANTANTSKDQPLSEIDSVFLRRDLEIAKDVQKASLPQRPPTIPGLSCTTFYQPAHSVGGDYYDFLRLQDGAWGIAIGDVSGKGIGAALVMANLRASLRAQTLHPRSDPETLVSNLNRLVCESSPMHFFASLFYGEYQPASRILRYVNAGHNPPLVLRRNDDRCEVLPLKPGCVPVGAFEDSRYTSTRFQLEIGDVLVAYTDGITEVQNSLGDLLGQERLERILRGCVCQDPRDILQHILEALSAYSAGCLERDDSTLVVIQVQAQGSPRYTPFSRRS